MYESVATGAALTTLSNVALFAETSARTSCKAITTDCAVDDGTDAAVGAGFKRSPVGAGVGAADASVGSGAQVIAIFWPESQ